MLELFRKYPALLDNLRGPILEEKVVDFLLELAQVTDRVVTPEELAKEPPSEIPAAASSSLEAAASGPGPSDASPPDAAGSEASAQA